MHTLDHRVIRPLQHTMGQYRKQHNRSLAKPFIKVLLYECIILQMRIGSADAIDFRALSWSRVPLQGRDTIALRAGLGVAISHECPECIP